MKHWTPANPRPRPSPWLAIAAVVASLSLHGAAHAQAGAPEPSAFELEMWRSATRINTPAAYSEYLARFPNGSFAGMAQAALRNGAAGPAAGDAASAGAPSPALLAKTEALREAEPETGAVTFRVGDRFHGPGIVRSGWYGAKRQIVLPAGEWVVLAAYDHFIDTFTRVQMTSVAFGRFRGERLDSVIGFVSNSRQVPVISATPTAGTSPLAMVERCTDGGDGGFAEVSSTARLQTCTKVTRQATVDLRAALPGQLGTRVAALLDKLGVSMAGPATRSVLETLTSAPHYATYVRVDAEDTRDLKTRVDAFKRSRDALLQGINYRYDDDDLVPGVRKGTASLNIGD